MLSPQVPQWSRHSVACVRRHGDRPPPLISCGKSILAKMGRQGIIIFYQWKKWNGSRHLVFWSLGTLTGLKNWVWKLIA